MYTLTLCIGLFLSICGQQRTYDFPDFEACERERVRQVIQQQAQGRGGWAVCAPKTSPINREIGHD